MPMFRQAVSVFLGGERKEERTMGEQERVANNPLLDLTSEEEKLRRYYYVLLQ